MTICCDRRSLGGVQADFARQLVERNGALRPDRKFRTSAPKGVRLGSEYVDRAKDRKDEEAADDRAERLKALEQSLKEEKIDQATFEKLRFEIAGGDLESTHLVKGLDFKLLKRIREGEDVYGSKEEASAELEPDEPGGDVDDEFDELESKDVEAVAKDKASKKKGQLSTVSLAPGKKRTRDQILAELKASREAAAKAQQQESALGGRFRKINNQHKPGSRIERDGKGREVLIIVDEDGHEKRKVRKLQPGEREEESTKADLLVPDKDAKPLGMEVPEQYQKPEEEVEESDGDVDIFDDAGDDYDPLAGMDTDSDSERESDEGESKPEAESHKDAEPGEIPDKAPQTGLMAPPPKPPAAQDRNYFKNSKTGLLSTTEAIKAPSMSDPAIMAAFKRAAALNVGKDRDEEDDGEDEDESEADRRERKAKEERRRKMLSTVDRDDEDLDMGFGTSRFEDEQDGDDSQVKLSRWGDEDGDEGQSKGGPGKRKRGPKKRQGDANNAADVLRVMEQRKQAKGGS